MANSPKKLIRFDWAIKSLLRKKLNYLNMSEKERERYDRYLINLQIEKDVIETAREEGETIAMKRAKK